MRIEVETRGRDKWGGPNTSQDSGPPEEVVVPTGSPRRDGPRGLAYTTDPV